MITKTNSFKTSDGEVFEHLLDAQGHEIEIVLKSASVYAGIQNLKDTDLIETAAKAILETKDKIMDALTTGPRSKPRARSINGATRKRRAAATPTPEGKP